MAERGIILLLVLIENCRSLHKTFREESYTCMRLDGDLQVHAYIYKIHV